MVLSWRLCMNVPRYWPGEIPPFPIPHQVRVWHPLGVITAPLGCDYIWPPQVGTTPPPIEINMHMHHNELKSV